MVPLDHGDRPARPEEAPQCPERSLGVGQMLEHEADEDVVEGPVPERQGRYLAADEVGGDSSGLRRPERDGREIDRDKGDIRVSPGDLQSLSSRPAPGLEDEGAGRIPGVVVKEIGERRGLIVKPKRFVLRIPVDIAPFSDRHGTEASFYAHINAFLVATL